MDEINRTTRTRKIEFVLDEEDDSPDISGDFSSEGIADLYRSGEIKVPSEVYATYVQKKDFEWYCLRFKVCFIPPKQKKITYAQVRLQFKSPIEQVGAWYPNDFFSSYKKMLITQNTQARLNTDISRALLAEIPYLNNLLPQLSVEYGRYVVGEKMPMESVIRTTSDGQRFLQFDLSEDPKTEIDQRLLEGQVLFGSSKKLVLDETHPLLSFDVNCNCGKFRLKTEVKQDVDITIRKTAALEGLT